MSGYLPASVVGDRCAWKRSRDVYRRKRVYYSVAVRTRRQAQHTGELKFKWRSAGGCCGNDVLMGLHYAERWRRCVASAARGHSPKSDRHRTCAPFRVCSLAKPGIYHRGFRDLKWALDYSKSILATLPVAP